MLYSATSGSKPISPIATTIPMMQMFDFVTLNDIHSLLVWQVLLLFSAFSFRISALICALWHIAFFLCLLLLSFDTVWYKKNPCDKRVRYDAAENSTKSGVN